MNIIIIAALSLSIAYFAIAFIATVHDRIAARFAAGTDYGTKPKPVAAATFQLIRPLPVIQSSRAHRCLGIRPLRNEIKRRGLAVKCQEINGKSWSRCTQNQLIAVFEG